MARVNMVEQMQAEAAKIAVFSIVSNIVLFAVGLYFLCQGTNWEFGLGLGLMFMFLKGGK
jgi:hypothetical protein